MSQETEQALQKTEERWQKLPTIEYQFHLPHFLKLKGATIKSVEYPHPNNYLTSEGLVAAIIEADPNTLNQLETLQFGQPLTRRETPPIQKD